MSKATPKAPDVPAGATLGSWRGIPTYCCTKCGYDTVERTKFEDHYAVAHPEPQDHWTEPTPEPVDPVDTARLEG